MVNRPCVWSSCDEDSPIPQIFIFVGETLLSMNWAIVADILLVSSWATPGLAQRLMRTGSGGRRSHFP